MPHIPSQPIDRLHAAESVVALLARLDVSAFPWEERLAVGACQARAIDDWLEAYSQSRRGPRPGDLPRRGAIVPLFG